VNDNKTVPINNINRTSTMLNNFILVINKRSNDDVQLGKQVDTCKNVNNVCTAYNMVTYFRQIKCCISSDIKEYYSEIIYS